MCLMEGCGGWSAERVIRRVMPSLAVNLCLDTAPPPGYLITAAYPDTAVPPLMLVLHTQLERWNISYNS